MATDETKNRVLNTGSFFIAIRKEKAFPLFTAIGERLWAPGWDPMLLGSDDQNAGLVFLTDHGGENTIWTVFDSDQQSGRLRYSRVTPGVRAGIVDVSLSEELNGCRVYVTYDMTALPGSGPDALSPYRSPQFQAMLGEWKVMLERLIERQPQFFIDRPESADQDRLPR